MELVLIVMLISIYVILIINKKLKLKQMNNESRTIKITEFIKFNCNLNNPQLKNLGDVIWVVHNKLKLSVKDNEIMISADEDDVNNALEELELIYTSFKVNNDVNIQ